MGINELDICMVQDDGLWFWPRMGAHPEEGFTKLKEAFDRAICHPGDYTREDNRTLLGARDQLDQTSPKTVWQKITSKSPPDSMSNACLSSITEITCSNRTMVIDLADPVVKQRLGL